jgi:hypothetical protein
VTTFFATVPETAVNENCQHFFRKIEIGIAKYSLMKNPAFDPRPYQSHSEGGFRRLVLCAANRGHSSGMFGRQAIKLTVPQLRSKDSFHELQVNSKG